MPQATKQKEEYRQKSRPAGTPGEKLKFVHYTSAESALKIIKSKRLWMRNTTCMADYREVKHGFDLLLKFFSDKKRKDAFISALDGCVPKAAVEAIDLFDKWWDPNNPQSNIQLNTYIASVSEYDEKENFNGRLSMWRGFGGNGARVALVFSIPDQSEAGSALKLIFSPVTYSTEKETHDVIDDVIKNIQKNSDFLSKVDRQMVVATVFTMLLVSVTCLKHEGFKEENEWRAIYTPKMNPSSLMKSSVEIIGGIPQLVYQIPLEKQLAPELSDLDFSHMFDRLIIGPSQYPWAMYEAFVDELAKAGVTD